MGLISIHLITGEFIEPKSASHKTPKPKKIISHISSHSMGARATQNLLKSSTSLPSIMNKKFWSKTDTVMRYLESERFN